MKKLLFLLLPVLCFGQTTLQKKITILDYDMVTVSTPAKKFGQVVQYIDGTLSSTANEFIDKSGNGYNLDIINRDFNTNGFPYKSIAFVAQKAANFGKIPNPNYFWFTAGGTPNQIPVNLLFQNIDYGYQIFCKHQSALYNGTGEQYQEPKVMEIVTYTTALSGNNLTLANTYFGVPTEPVANTIWVNASTGSDANAGTKLLPVATFTKANSLAGTDIYLQTGAYNTNSTYILLTKNVKGLGYSTVLNQNAASYGLLINAVVTVSGIYMTHSSADNYFCFNSGTNSATIDKCYSTGTKLFNLANAGTGFFTITNSIVNTSASANQAFQIAIQNFSVSNCYINDQSTDRVFSQTSTTGSLVTNIKYNKIVSPTGTIVYYTTKNHDNINIVNNAFNTGASTLMMQTSALSHPLYFCYNTGNIGYISVLTGTGSIVCRKNTLTNNNANPFLITSDRNVTFCQNNISVAGAGQFLQVTTASVITTVIDSNRFVSTGNGGEIILGTGSDLNNGITGEYKYNYMESTNLSSTNQHGIQAFNSTNFEMAYNFTKNVQFPFIFKGASHDFTGSSMHHNVYLNGYIILKGSENAKVYNNTCYNDGVWDIPCIDVLINVTGTANNNIIKNNIFQSAAYTSTTALIVVEQSTITTTINYNDWYSGGVGMPIGKVVGTTYNWSGWQGLGYEANGINTNPNFTSVTNSLWPVTPLTATDNSLGSPYNVGLDILSNYYLTSSNIPKVIAKTQSGTWQNGAYIQ